MPMRPIKFRAYDKNKKRWILNYAHIGTNGKMYVAFDTPDMDLAVQQWTGLLDKSGKEIYEGDIVKIDDHWDDDWNKAPITVKYDDGAFYPWGTGDWEVNSEEWEIVGNIYENPELLK